MPIFWVAIRDREQEQYYRVGASPRWVQSHDNGAVVSCGLTVGEDGFTARMLASALKRFPFVRLTREQWNHSGCLSYCVLRGDTVCRW